MINLLNTLMTSFCQVSTLEMKIFRGYIFPRDEEKTNKKSSSYPRNLTNSHKLSYFSQKKFPA